MVKEIMLSKEERQWLKVSGSRLRIGARGGLTGIKLRTTTASAWSGSSPTCGRTSAP